ncbi:MAG TPA: HPr family phosphocarrier protein [Acholeplasmataceae bacterium]|nr:HPr family phosphocarrier protein [Acholeplasmataceae bacterium]
MTIENTSGINAQKAQEVVRAASDYESEITMKYLNKEVDLKSILGIMSLAVLEGARVEIEAKGEDAEEAIKAIKEVLAK